MNFAKPPVLRDLLTNPIARVPGLAPPPGETSTALTNPLLQSSRQGTSAASAIAFIDANVPDYQTLLAGIAPGTEVHVLNDSQDAITQITNTLLGRHNISSLHIVSHGEAGGLDFGSSALNLSDLPQYAAQLKTWSKALTNDADILLYGCDVAQGELGKAFATILSQLTGADVAASTNLTGNSALGGDWNLEFNTGSIESSLAFQQATLKAYTAILPSGQLDTSFDADGKVITNFGGDDTIYSLAVQAGGKILAAGTTSVGGNYNFILARYNTDGSLDTSFGTSGSVTVDFGSNDDVARSIAIQADGKILLAGYAATGSLGAYNFALARFTANGALDTSFDTDGKVTTGSTLRSDQAFSVAVQSDGKIVAAGSSSNDFELRRYNTDGSLDTSFGSSGSVTTDIGSSSTDAGNSVAIQSDGKIVVVGSSGGNFATARYTTSGSLDTSFNTSGKSTVNFGANTDSANSVIIQPDGKILVAGAGTNDGSLNYDMVRYNTNGTLDTTFGSSGKADTTFGFNDVGTGIALQADGTIVIGGYTNAFSSGQTTNDFALLRYTANGILDTNFGNAGKVITDIGNGTDDHAYSIVIQSDTKVVIGGGTGASGSSDFALVRYETSPTVTFVGGAISYTENGAPVVLDVTATVTDPDSVNFNTGTLTVGYSAGGTVDDRLAILNQGIAAGQIGVAGSTVTYGGTTIGTFTGGTGTTPLVVTFNSNVTPTVAQALLRNITYSNVSDNPATAPRTVSVVFTDGSGGTSTAATNTINVTAVNDAPTLTTNTLTITEGATVVLSNSNLNTTDPDNTPAQLTYTATGVTNGRFELVSAPGTAITSFTQAQINAGAVQFVQNGSESAPAYSLTVSDGSLTSAPSTVAIGTFTNVNDAPTLTTNTLTIAEGATVVLSNSNLNTTDPDNTPAQLTYTATGVTNGRFELVSAPGTAITSFTQAQINAGAVQFVQNGSESAPAYSLTVSDGSLTSAPSTVAIGTFTNVNDAPTLTTNTLAIAEGATVVLSNSNLNATDPDNTPAQLTYTATGVTNGQFELVANPGAAITSFTQAQVNNGQVRFVQNGSESAPAYSLTVSDGSLTSAPSTVVPTFTNVNDAPTVSINTLSIAEGATVVLSNSNLNATDPDNTPAQLTYTATGVTNGQFELVANPGAAITSFTQAQVNNGQVRFVQNGSESAPTYNLTVNDGTVSSAPSTVAIGTFTNVNDAPTVSTNTLSIAEGATVVLSNSNLNTTDPDNTPAQLTYTATGVTNGQFELVANPGAAITSFTQAQVNNGQVRFVQNGSESAPAYSLTVSDGSLTSAPSTVAIGTFTNVNDAPTLTTNTLAIAEGATVVLSNSNLNATDPDNTPAQLTYTATGVTNGQFELVANPGAAITSFTQAQVNNGQVRFVQNGSESAPTYNLTVNDGSLTSAPSTVTVSTFTNVNDAPTVSTNTLSIAEGATVVLSNSSLNATDPDNNPAQLTYTATGVTNGQFELVANPGAAITSFTQAQVNNGQVRFVQNGSESAPTYNLTVNDGSLTSAPSTVAIGTFTNVNDAPTLTTNTLAIAEGATVVLSNSNLNTTDPDNTPAQLTYTATGVTNGRFELVSAPGTAITSFTQAQINAGAVQFVQNGSESAPAYSLTVSDGSLTSAPSTVTVPTFTNVNDAPTLTTNTLTIAEGATVVLSSSNLNTTDPDNTPAQLTYTATGVTNGRFELVSAPGTAITSFTQAQINAGAVQFVQNGSESAPAYSLTVSDGSLTSAPSTVTVPTFTNVNDAPTLTTNTLSIAEGATVVLSNSNLNTTDPDNTPAQLTYSATGVTNGRFELVSAPGTAITSFTQAQINAGAVQFVQNGSESAPAYSLTVSDGSLTSASSTVVPTFTNVNDAPTLTTNTLSIAEGATVVLSNSNLNTTDPDNTPAQLTYSATGVTNGRFEFVSAPGTAITSFTQAQINAGAVQFVQNGSESAPAYSLTVSDGSLASAPSTVAIGTFTNVNDAPTLTTNTLTIAEGATVVLSNSNLNTTDPDNTPAQLTYSATGVTNGRFELVSAPGTAITSFTQAQINAGAVQFVQNGSESAPAYSLTVSDGSLTSAPSTVAIGTFTTANDAPSLTGNATLAAVVQNSTNPSGGTITSLFSSLFSDPDTGASLSGLAIVGNTASNTTQGHWQYSLDGTTWTDIGVVAEGNTALALSATTRVRFVPVTGYNGTPPGLSVRALDNTYSSGFTTGNTRVTVNTTTNGGTTAIASTTALLNTSVTTIAPNLLWRNSGTGQNAVWQLNNFSLQSSYYLPDVTEAGWVVVSGTADFNQDGIADILWRNQINGKNAIWQMGSSGLQSGYFLTTVADTGWQMITATDFNQDGTPDLLWRNTRTGENAIWQMNGFSVQSTTLITAVADTNWQIASTGNFSSDSIPDLLWRNVKTGENAIWQMNGFSVQSTTLITPLADTNWQIAGTGNFNGDATSDIVWRNKATGQNAIWQMNGTTLSSGYFITSLTDTNWQIAGVASLGGDSTPEILWRNKQAMKEMIWQLNGFSYSQTYQLPDLIDPNWSGKPLVAVQPLLP